MSVPDVLCHYYEAANGPFRSLSALPIAQAEAVLERIRRSGHGFASQRQADYLTVRAEVEARVRRLFIDKGGQPTRTYPHSMVLGRSAWIKGWYVEGCELCLPLGRFPPPIVSFTYGDIFPAMRYQDGKPYRGQVYRLDELPALIEQYGLPQEWNAAGRLGPERYIEAQVWDDAPLLAYLGANP